MALVRRVCNMAAQPDWDQLLQQSEDLAARVRCLMLNACACELPSLRCRASVLAQHLPLVNLASKRR